MAFISSNNGPHQSPQSSLPPLSLKTVNTGTWGANGNTCVITDPYAHVNSAAIIWVSGVTPQVGNWAWTCAQGTITITSTDSESASLTLNYIIL
jgi:hypothetical protein